MQVGAADDAVVKDAAQRSSRNKISFYLQVLFHSQRGGVDDWQVFVVVLRQVLLAPEAAPSAEHI